MQTELCVVIYLCSLLFFAPKTLRTKSLFLFLSLRAFLRLGVQSCARVRVYLTEYKLKSRLFFLFFSWRKDAFSLSLSKQSREKARDENRDLSLVKKNGFKHKHLLNSQLNFHINKKQEEKNTPNKQTNYFFTRRSFFSTSRKRSFSPRRISLRRLCTRRDPTSRRRVLPCQNRSCLDETFRSFFSPLFVCRLEVERTGFSIWFSRQ